MHTKFTQPCICNRRRGTAGRIALAEIGYAVVCRSKVALNTNRKITVKDLSSKGSRVKFVKDKSKP